MHFEIGNSLVIASMALLILTVSGFCKFNQIQVENDLTGWKHDTLIQHKHIEMNNPKLTINVCDTVKINKVFIYIYQAESRFWL